MLRGFISITAMFFACLPTLSFSLLCSSPFIRDNVILVSSLLLFHASQHLSFPGYVDDPDFFLPAEPSLLILFVRRFERLLMVEPDRELITILSFVIRKNLIHAAQALISSAVVSGLISLYPYSSYVLNVHVSVSGAFSRLHTNADFCCRYTLRSKFRRKMARSKRASRRLHGCGGQLLSVQDVLIARKNSVFESMDMDLREPNFTLWICDMLYLRI